MDKQWSRRCALHTAGPLEQQGFHVGHRCTFRELLLVLGNIVAAQRRPGAEHGIGPTWQLSVVQGKAIQHMLLEKHAHLWWTWENLGSLCTWHSPDAQNYWAIIRSPALLGLGQRCQCVHLRVLLDLCASEQCYFLNGQHLTRLDAQAPCGPRGAQKICSARSRSGEGGCWELRRAHGMDVWKVRGELQPRTAHFNTNILTPLKFLLV